MMEHPHCAGVPQLLAQATAPRSPIKVFLGMKLPGRVTTPAVMVLVMEPPSRGTVPQDLVELTVPQLLTELTLAMEPPGRPTVPVKGITVTQPPCGGTVPQLLAGVSAGSGGRPSPPPRAWPRGPAPPPRVGPTCLSRGRPAGWPPMRRP